MPTSTVLLFSPDPAAREEVEAVLRTAGFPVTAVTDRAEALQRAGEHQVVVVDVPAQPGAAADFSRTIRRDAALGGLPILAIAQADDVEERIELIEAGADDVIARPFDPRELDARMAALELRLAQPEETSAEPAVVVERPVERRLVVAFGPKGGTGTTTIAVNIALALANHRPEQVAIIDLDMQFGQVVTYLDVTPKRTLADMAADEAALDDPETVRSYATVVSPGLAVYAAPASPALAELVTPAVIQRMLKTARAMYQVIVVDAGSHLDEGVLQVLEAANAVILAVRPEVAALRAVLALTSYLQEVRALPTDTIYVANHLSSREMVKLQDIEGVLGARIAVEIPNDPDAFLRAVNEGVPVIRAAPKSVAAQRLARLAAMALGDTHAVEKPAPEKPRRRLLGLRASR